MLAFIYYIAISIITNFIIAYIVNFYFLLIKNRVEINIIKNIFLIDFNELVFTLSGNVRSVGLTTFFQYSEENKSFYLNSNLKFLKNKKIGLIINHTSKVPINELREYSLEFLYSTLELFEK